MTTPTFIQSPPRGPREVVPPLWTTASLRRRTFAALIDVIVTTAAAIVVTLPLVPSAFSEQAGFFAGMTAQSSVADLLTTAAGVAAQMVIWTLYVGLLSSRSGPGNGQTLGKQLLDIRAVATDGSALGGALAWRRAAWTGAITSIPSIIGLVVDAGLGTAPGGSNLGDATSTAVVLAAYATALADPRRRTFYDRSAGTVVVGADALRSGVDEGGPIEPRRRSIATWVLTVIAFIVVGYLVLSTLWPSLG